jgi:drug/metabolite transporter (DMT)-like permease
LTAAPGHAASGRGLAAAGLLLNALVWGLAWWPFRHLQAQGVHALWATALSYGLAATLLWALRPAALGQVLATPALWWLVLASGGTNAAFNWAVTIGDVVRVVLLFYLMPLWAVLLAWLLLRERPGRAGVLRVALALAGALVVLWPEGGQGWPLPRSLADVLGLLGGFSFALNNVLLRREAHRPAPARALAMFAGGALVSAAAALALGPGGGVPRLPAEAGLAAGWMPLLLLVTVGFLAANLGLQYGAARLAAGTTAVLMVSEVVIASVSSVALGAASFSWRAGLGGGLILLAAALAAWGEPHPGDQAAGPGGEAGPRGG